MDAAAAEALAQIFSWNVQMPGLHGIKLVNLRLCDCIIYLSLVADEAGRR